MVVDQGGGAMLDGIHQADQRRVAHVLLGKGSIQAPPQLGQDLWKVTGRIARDGHAPGKSTVKVGMATDVARHDELAARVHDIMIRIGRHQFGCVPDGSDQ